MLMVLMAIVELGRSKVLKASRWLWMVLTGGLWMGAQTGCFDPEPGDTSDVTIPDGIQPDVAEDVRDLDVPILPELPDPGKDCGLVTYYGPKPCDSNQECVDDYGPGWYCDTENVFSDPCGGAVTWPMCKQGDVPDAVEPDAADDVLDAVNPDTPTDPGLDCEPMVAYGPPPCVNDEDCTPWGEDYYCDKANPYVDPCRGTTMYMCAQGPKPADVIEPVDAVDEDTPTDPGADPGAVVFYGPPPVEPEGPSD